MEPAKFQKLHELRKTLKHKRTEERFKYRNQAVMQGTILGLEKLLFITCAEFAHDDGTFYHGVRSLAKAMGVSKSVVAVLMNSLVERGVLILISKGKAKYNSSKYRINLSALPEKTVYDLVKHDRTASTKTPGTASQTEPSATRTVLETDRPPAGRSDPQPSAKRTKDIDFDLDTSPLVPKIGAGEAKPTPLLVKERLKDQSQIQNRQGSGLRFDSSEQSAEQKQTQREVVVQTKTNGGSVPPRSAPPPIECPDCFYTMDNHHKNCPTLREKVNHA